EISYQAAAVISHFQDRLREDLRPNIDQDWWVAQARKSSVRSLHWLEQHVRYLIDPDSFDHQVEEDWEKRFLSISESGGMFHISGVLDRVGGAALEAAIESFSKRAGTADGRTPKQRRADALVEVVKSRHGQGHPAATQRGAAAYQRQHHDRRSEGRARCGGLTAGKRDADLQQDRAAPGM